MGQTTPSWVVNLPGWRFVSRAMILNGEKAADLAVEAPKNLELYVNKEMAKKLGIDLSGMNEKK